MLLTQVFCDLSLQAHCYFLLESIIPETAQYSHAWLIYTIQASGTMMFMLSVIDFHKPPSDTALFPLKDHKICNASVCFTRQPL
jgi:hypothetical protein